MAEGQSVFAVRDFKQVIHADEVPVQVHLVDPGAIVIPNDQSLLSPQSFQYRFGIGATEEHISHYRVHLSTVELHDAENHAG